MAYTMPFFDPRASFNRTDYRLASDSQIPVEAQVYNDAVNNIISAISSNNAPSANDILRAQNAQALGGNFLTPQQRLDLINISMGKPTSGSSTGSSSSGGSSSSSTSGNSGFYKPSTMQNAQSVLQYVNDWLKNNFGAVDTSEALSSTQRNDIWRQNDQLRMQGLLSMLNTLLTHTDDQPMPANLVDNRTNNWAGLIGSLLGQNPIGANRPQKPQQQVNLQMGSPSPTPTPTKPMVMLPTMQTSFGDTAWMAPITPTLHSATTYTPNITTTPTTYGYGGGNTYGYGVDPSMSYGYGYGGY